MSGPTAKQVEAVAKAIWEYLECGVCRPWSNGSEREHAMAEDVARNAIWAWERLRPRGGRKGAKR